MCEFCLYLVPTKIDSCYTSILCWMKSYIKITYKSSQIQLILIREGLQIHTFCGPVQGRPCLKTPAKEFVFLSANVGVKIVQSARNVDQNQNSGIYLGEVLILCICTGWEIITKILRVCYCFPQYLQYRFSVLNRTFPTRFRAKPERYLSRGIGIQRIEMY